MISQLDARTRRVVAAIDRDDWQRAVLEHALTGMDANRPQHLHVVTVLPRREARQTTAALDDLGKLVLDVATQLAPAIERQPKVWTHARPGDPVEEIALLAEEVEADAILVGPPTTVEGSVAPKLVTAAPCAVEVVRPKDYGTRNQTTCAACVEVRAESHGERWFCADHSDSAAPRLVSRVPRLDLSAWPTQFG